MKKIFIPLVRLFQWLGKTIRIIWSGKKMDKSTLHLEKKKNGWIGLGFTTALSILGICSTTNDMHKLESTMQQSIEQIVQMDYLASQADKITSSIKNIKINQYDILRGRAKYLSTMGKNGIDFVKEINFSHQSDTSIRRTMQCVIDTREVFFKQTLGFIADVTQFVSNEVMYNNTEDRSMTLHLVKMRELFKELSELEDEFIEENKNFKKELNNISNKRTAKRIGTKILNSKIASKVIINSYKSINEAYDMIVQMEMYELYSGGDHENNKDAIITALANEFINANNDTSNVVNK